MSLPDMRGQRPAAHAAKIPHNALEYVPHFVFGCDNFGFVLAPGYSPINAVVGRITPPSASAGIPTEEISLLNRPEASAPAAAAAAMLNGKGIDLSALAAAAVTAS